MREGNVQVKPKKLGRGQARRLVEDVWRAYGEVPWATIDGWLARGATLAFYETLDGDGRVQRRVQHFGPAYLVQECHEDMRLVATFAGVPLSTARPSQEHPLGVETGAQDPDEASVRARSTYLRSEALRAGASEEEAALLVSMGVDAGWISGPVREAIPFLDAANFHTLELGYIEALLNESRGKPYQAWELWGRTRPRSWY